MQFSLGDGAMEGCCTGRGVTGLGHRAALGQRVRGVGLGEGKCFSVHSVQSVVSGEGEGR